MATLIEYVARFQGYNIGDRRVLENEERVAELVNGRVASVIERDVAIPGVEIVMPKISDTVQRWREQNGHPRIPTAEEAEAPAKPRTHKGR